MSSCVDVQVIPSSFEHSLVVMTTTHKTFHGPRAGRTFYHRRVRSVDKQGKKVMCDLEKRTDTAMFPGLQGGPHNNMIAGITVALKQVQSPQHIL